VVSESNRYASIISGIPGHDIEDVTLNNIRIYYQGGGTKEQALLQPPDRETSYPEPSMFGEIPAYGFFIRHVKGIKLHNVEVSYLREDLRPAFVILDVTNAGFFQVKAQKATGASVFDLKNVLDFRTWQCADVPNMHLERVDQRKF